VGRDNGFTDSDPVGSAVLDPRGGQLRRAARRAAHVSEQAEVTLEEASGVIANGYLRTARSGTAPSRSAAPRSAA
jgi:hypothetical protein